MADEDALRAAAALGKAPVQGGSAFAEQIMSKSGNLRHSDSNEWAEVQKAVGAGLLHKIKNHPYEVFRAGFHGLDQLNIA